MAEDQHSDTPPEDIASDDSAEQNVGLGGVTVGSADPPEDKPLTVDEAAQHNDAPPTE